VTKGKKAGGRVQERKRKGEGISLYSFLSCKIKDRKNSKSRERETKKFLGHFGIFRHRQHQVVQWES